MERGGRDVFADAALARQKHGDVLRRDARDDVEHAADRGALGDERPAHRRLRPQTCVLELQVARLDGARDGEHELVGVERLRQVVERARLHRRDRDALGAVRREHHHRNARILRADGREHRHAVDARHREIRQDDVGAVGLERRDAVSSAVGARHLETGVAEDGFEREAHRRFVVDDEDSCHGPKPITTLGTTSGARS